MVADHLGSVRVRLSAQRGTEATKCHIIRAGPRECPIDDSHEGHVPLIFRVMRARDAGWPL